MGRFAASNAAAVTHGATSPARIAPIAARQKRSFLRRNRLRTSDLDAIGGGLLVNWSRASAALALLDEYASAHGWLDEQGTPRPFTKLYLAALNSERHALRALQAHLRERRAEPLAQLQAEGRVVRLAAEERLRAS